MEKEEGNFSDKVCKSIVFRDTATSEKIYQAIMQYDAKLESDKLKEEAKIKEQEILDNVVKMMENDEQEFYKLYLTKDKDGPRLNEDQVYDIRNKLLAIIDNAEFIHDKTKRSEYRIKINNKSPFRRIMISKQAGQN